MAYFLKKTNNKKGTYLQIYSSFYDPERRHTAHKAYKPIGYVHELQAKGIPQSLENRRILPDHEVTAGCQTGILAKTGYHCWTFFNLLSGRITDKITAVQDIKKWL